MTLVRRAARLAGFPCRGGHSSVISRALRCRIEHYSGVLELGVIRSAQASLQVGIPGRKAQTSAGN